MDKPYFPPIQFDDTPDPRQIEVWRRMTGAQRLEIAFQLYQMALEAMWPMNACVVRSFRVGTELACHPSNAGRSHVGEKE